MSFDLLKAATRALAVSCMLWCTVGYAQVPYEEVHTVALADGTHAVPVEHPLDITLAGTYQVTLADLGTTPLASVKLAITQGNTLIGTPLTAAGSVQFNASVGTYIIHVIGTLPLGTDNRPKPGSGPIGINVTDVTTNTPFASFSDTLGLAATGLPNNTGVIDDTFTVSSSGSYVVTLSDLQLPQALPTLTLFIVTAVDSVPVTSPPLTAAGSTTVSLQQGVSYRIFAAGQADSTVAAGLYSAVVAPAAGGSPAYSKVVPVGKVGTPQTVTLTSGTSYTLTMADLGVPSPLSALGAAVTFNGQSVASLAAAGTSAPFTAGSGTYSVYSMGSTATSGSYAVSIAPQGGGAAASSYARAVAATGSAYSYDATISAAGSYTLSLSDLAVPQAFSSLSAVAVQAGAPLGALLAAGATNQTFNAAAGPVSLLVFAQPGTPTSSSSGPGGLFDVALTAGSGGATAFETTQGVGQLFSTRQISITTAGSYAVNVSDLGFPTPLSSLAVIVTQGSSRVGSIYTGGAFAFTATPGNYFINFIAQPAAPPTGVSAASTDAAGTYALSVAAGPSVTLQSNLSTVGSGSTVNLQWSSQNATSCTASDGWSGAQNLSGTFTTAALTTTTKFTLTCSGEGVQAVQSITVNVQAPPQTSGGGGGGGALGLESLLALSGLLFLNRRTRRLLSERSEP